MQQPTWNTQERFESQTEKSALVCFFFFFFSVQKGFLSNTSSGPETHGRFSVMGDNFATFCVLYQTPSEKKCSENNSWKQWAHTQNWLQMKCEVFWARISSFGQLGFITDPHINFQKSWNGLSHDKRPDNINYTSEVLTHLCRVDSSTLTLWTDPFPI